ncbi:RagB/SusD family nutrient uptake outer membrane protein [Flavobacterium sp. WLB]|uniref:RagB/SusD family nutrient uptake outer membrane protein n=1 Tax=unclassified Flavobacterium TaxID=196869 RepID=UPI0006ABE900|nr:MULTISPECIES: RagB/SusD family nutrient uptake outer membrane protein [unclassified Flavobacterium]KOP37644.1 carbohydrate-binding protein SusD [Flavobacterium sp. VMW]OWU91524.1 carbohydrate-binding protein SusD [Flavobacterium sp. NLM]PUU68771.1 RagB/SusD family nutrient uptake outer membrane protein [Flavobacterium sp. WLB]
MKTIKLKYIFCGIAMAAIGSCSEDFITTSPKGKLDAETYYSNESQTYAALVGVYDPIRKNTGGFENIVAMMNAGSDDFWAGGGSATDGAGIQNFSSHSLTSTLMPASYWNDHYQGIYRANVLISKLPSASMSDAVRARFTAEAKSLRALYYFNLVRMFKNIPLILEPLTASDIFTPEQAKPEDVYAQIEKDLREAIPVLPGTVPAGELGRMTKGGAQALLGKVYLFDGKNAEAATVLAEVNGTPGATNQYGNKLLAKFSDLWVVANKFNAESLIEVSHSSAGNSDWGFWGSGRDEGNSLNVMVGPRSYTRSANSSAPDLPSGWSFSVPTQKLYDAMKNDPRFEATILDVKALKAAGKADYIAANQDTGYFLNKFLPRMTDVRTGGGAAELNYKQDSYVIRLADTYLLEAEALGATGARAQALLDAVRARVGLASVPVTLAAIKNERRMELAGEGHRFFDLVRWGDAAAALADRGFTAGTDEIFPIPYVELTGTKLQQNPNYQ